MTNLRQQVTEILEKHPGHDDQNVHDPRGGRGKQSDDGNFLDPVRFAINRLTGRIPEGNVPEFAREWSKLSQLWAAEDRLGQAALPTPEAGLSFDERLYRVRANLDAARSEIAQVRETAESVRESLGTHSVRPQSMTLVNDPHTIGEIVHVDDLPEEVVFQEAETATVLFHGTAQSFADQILSNGLQNSKILGRSGSGWGYDADADGEADDYIETGAIDGRVSHGPRVERMREWVRLHPDIAQSRANSVYLAQKEDIAERYAYDSAKRAGSERVAMVQVTVPPSVRVYKDEFWESAHRLEGSIPPSWITGIKYGTVHPNGVFWTGWQPTAAASLKSLVAKAMVSQTFYVPVVFG